MLSGRTNLSNYAQSTRDLLEADMDIRLENEDLDNDGYDYGVS